VDLQVLVTEIEAEVRRRRDAGDYPEALLEALHAEFRAEVDGEPPEASAVITAARPLRGSRPLIGPATVFAKRLVRRLLAWYVGAIAADQTRFNLAVLRELRALEERVRELERDRPERADAEDRPSQP
jgi:hypothetical protein